MNAVRVATEPVLPNLKITNRIELVDGPCRGFKAGISFDHADPKTLGEIALGGQFSRRCNVYGMGRTVLQHDTYAFGLFEALWADVGGKFGGDLRKTVVAPEANRRKFRC